MTDSPGWAAPDSPGPDDPRRSPRSPAEAAASDEDSDRARGPEDGPDDNAADDSDSADRDREAGRDDHAAPNRTGGASERRDNADPGTGSAADLNATPGVAADTGSGAVPDKAPRTDPEETPNADSDAKGTESPDRSDDSEGSDTSDAAPTPPAASTPPGWSAEQPPAASGGWGAPGGPTSPGPDKPDTPPTGRPPQPPPNAPGGWGAPGGPQQPTHGWGPPQARGPGWGAPRGWQGPYLPAAKPGIIPLRPLGVGELLDGAVAAMRTHWKVMIGLSLVVALITQAILVPIQWSMLRNVDTSVLDESNPDSDELVDALVPIFGSSAISFAVMLLAQLVITGILTLVVGRAVLGKNMTLGQAWSGTRPLLLRLLGVSVMTFVIPALLLVACLVPGLLIAFVSGDLGGAFIVIGAIGGVVLAVYAYILLQLSSPALILEKQTVRKALVRSRKLVTGSWWRVLGITLLIALLTAIIGGIVQLPFGLATGFSQFGTAVPDSFLDSVIMGIGVVVSYGLTFPFSAAALVLLYIDQRMRREALDLELARAAGLVPDDNTPAAP